MRGGISLDLEASVLKPPFFAEVLPEVCLHVFRVVEVRAEVGDVSTNFQHFVHNAPLEGTSDEMVRVIECTLSSILVNI